MDQNEDELYFGAMTRFVVELVSSPINLALLGLCAFLVYKIVKNRRRELTQHKQPELPPMKKSDFTLEQLQEYNGRRKGERILIAVNGKVFDVTRGSRFYGPDGPYGVFAGRDASRGLATFSLSEEAIKDEYDDLSDLNSMMMDSVREWEMQFTEKYDLVGRLLKPGEEPTDYTDTEEEHSASDRPKED